jgi:hypothetical protein
VNLTKQILFIAMIALGVYDFGVFIIGGEATTVSQVMTDYLHISPFGSFVMGCIFGHWLWPMTTSKTKQVGKT